MWNAWPPALWYKELFQGLGFLMQRREACMSMSVKLPVTTTRCVKRCVCIQHFNMQLEC